jgi:hypothetical protein
MHQALILIARAIALAHDHWRRSVGRRLSLSGCQDRQSDQEGWLSFRQGQVPGGDSTRCSDLPVITPHSL